jgi:hypothetical protein
MSAAAMAEWMDTENVLAYYVSRRITLRPLRDPVPIFGHEFGHHVERRPASGVHQSGSENVS